MKKTKALAGGGGERDAGTPCASKRMPGASLRTIVEELRAGQPAARHVGPHRHPPRVQQHLAQR